MIHILRIVRGIRPSYLLVGVVDTCLGRTPVTTGERARYPENNLGMIVAQ